VRRETLGRGIRRSTGREIMAGIDERIDESKNWFERLMEKIPGYRSYKEKELGREADKIERVHVAENLDSCLGKLDELKLDLMKTGNLEALGDVDVTMRKLRKVRDRIQFADYGYAGMFDTTKVGAQKIDELRAFDQGLETEAGGIRDLAAALAVGSASLSADIKLLDDRIEALDARFSERENLITGAGR
jgi:hypothetical protein